MNDSELSLIVIASAIYGDLTANYSNYSKLRIIIISELLEGWRQPSPLGEGCHAVAGCVADASAELFFEDTPPACGVPLSERGCC